MAYYTGSVNSYADLLSALLSACVNEGYTLDSGILSKGSVFVRPYVSALNNGTENPGLIVEAGTGVASGALVNPSPAKPRLGRPAITGQGNNSNVTWPAIYHLHIHSEPDEAFLILNHSVDAFWRIAFGVSDMPGISGSGVWVSGTAGRGGPSQNSAALGSFSMTTQGTAVSALSIGLPFWQSAGANVNFAENVIQTGLLGGLWVDSVAATFLAARFAFPHIDRSPSSWNSEAPLTPIQAYVGRPSSKVSLLLDVRHARYIRTDYYEPGQVIALGGERWKIYPGVRKNSDQRNGDSTSFGADHSGTLGFAVRYDGP